jgi:uncharacterized protein with von Willebrand factor type A (vWA) domain
VDTVLVRFVAALRHADVRVSPAETLDACAVLARVGIADVGLLRNALALTLAKTREDKVRFAECFDRFFRQLAFSTPAKQTFFRGIDRARLLDRLDSTLPDTARRVVGEVLRDQRSLLALRVEEAANAAGIESMGALRDKSVIADRIARALGADDLDRVVRQGPDGLESRDAHALRYVRSYVAEEIHRYVDTQYRIRVDASGRRALIESALDAQLNQIPPDYHREIETQVRVLAARLRRGRKRRKRDHRGFLDIKRTMRANVAYDEALFKLRWRSQRRTEATVFAICDVSSSVARISRFLLLLLYELADLLPNVRTFAFSHRLGEITTSFRNAPVERAIEEALFDWGKGTTDYGRAWLDFRDLALADVDHKSTVIVLGDARSNFFDPHLERFRDIARRASRLIWLNPEPRESWGQGDSEMNRYAPHCFRVWRLGSLADLARVAESLVSLR